MMDAPQPLYDISKSFEYHCAHGFNVPTISAQRRFPPKNTWINFLGYPVASRIGIPACAIMISKGISALSKLGFDIFTYKTIRIAAHPCHASPNIAYVHAGMLTHQNIGGKISAAKQPSTHISDIAITNSYGNGCADPAWTSADIAATRAALQPGQILIVSVFGNSTQEFVAAAQLAQHAGAHIIEANISCPNMISDHQPLCYDPEQVYATVHALVASVSIPVIIKVGFFSDVHLLRRVLIAAARAGAAGVCGINSVPMQVVNHDGNPVFGQLRKISGVSGAPIRNLALEFVVQARKIIDEENLKLVILATGGITQPHHFDLFLNAGATIALCATGAMWNPFLAMEYHQQQNISQKGEEYVQPHI